MGREARTPRTSGVACRATYPSRFARTWFGHYEPGALIVMYDRIYGVLGSGQLFRLPVRVAKNVKAC